MFTFAVLLPAVRQRNGTVRWTTVAVAAALISMLVHTIVEFNLPIPANAGLCAVLLGVLTAAAGDASPETDGTGVPNGES